MKFSKTLLLAILAVPAAAQQPEQTLTYRAEAAVTVSDGDYAPLWLTANRYGMTSNESKNAYLRAGITWNKSLKHNWRITAGLDLAGGKNLTSNFWLQQAYADISWKKLTLSLGSKERSGFPLAKNEQLTSGWMRTPGLRMVYGRKLAGGLCRNEPTVRKENKIPQQVIDVPPGEPGETAAGIRIRSADGNTVRR